ncbi:MAG TPA: hypothetical protein VK539_11225 [Myxococcaceae bacterium]|nr:hypothetical protein [Myxococcaceae bacterium]
MSKSRMVVVAIVASVSFWGCGGSVDQEDTINASHEHVVLDEAARLAHIAEHAQQGIADCEASETAQPGERSALCGGTVCYCYTCAKHHPPQCL